MNKGEIIIDKIVPKFKDSLILNTSDVLQDYAEIGIDSFFDNDIVKNIPVVKTIVSAKKVFDNITDRNLLKNLVIFINELNSGVIDREKLARHKKKLEDPKKAEKELGMFLILLNQTFNNEKSILYGKIYKAYINQKINWDEVVEFSEIVSRMFIQDLSILKELYLKKPFIVSNFTSNRLDIFRIERLYSLGIVGYSPKALFPGGGTENYVNLNELGKIFSETIFE